MATIIDLKKLTWPSICLQKKVILIHHLVGCNNQEFAKSLGVVNGYVSEIYHLGRLYNPKFKFLHSLGSTYSLNKDWLMNSDILPSEIGKYLFQSANSKNRKGLRFQNASLENHKFNECHL